MQLFNNIIFNLYCMSSTTEVNDCMVNYLYINILNKLFHNNYLVRYVYMIKKKM